jgi:hypothetical protein
MKTILIILGITILTLIILGVIAKYCIYLLKFKSENLKKRFPKHSWHIQRLHEIYIKGELNRGITITMNYDKFESEIKR